MKKLLIILPFLLLTFSAFSQKVKLKKKIAYVDEVAELSLESCRMAQAEGQTCLVKSVKTGEPLFSTYVYSAGAIGYRVDISFVDFNTELRIEGMMFKRIFSKMYEMKVINEDGTVNEANARKFARAYDSERTRRVIIVD